MAQPAIPTVSLRPLQDQQHGERHSRGARGWVAILEQRAENLTELVRSLSSGSGFYRAALAPFAGHRFTTIDEIVALPFTTRAELLAAAPLGTVLQGRSPQAYYESTGTTGAPLPGFPDLSPEKAASFATFLDRWMGLSRAKISTALVALAYEMTPAGFRFQLALPYLGITVIPCGVRSTVCPPEKTVQLIERLDPGAIFSRPFELLRFGDVLVERAVLPDQIAPLKLFHLGEIMSLAKHRRIEALWGGAELFGQYGLTEVDSGMHSCHLGRYHEPSNPFIHVELIDPSKTTPIEQGRWGEVVFTTLRPSHAPLVRYRTGDMARRVVCACGDPGSAYELRGRIRDGIEFAGRMIFPIDLEELLFTDSDIGNEHLMIALPEGRLGLRAERAFGSAAPCAEVADRLAGAVSDALEVEPVVEIIEYGGLADKLGIPRKKGGRFTDLRGLSSEQAAAELRINVVDGDVFRSTSGALLAL